MPQSLRSPMLGVLVALIVVLGFTFTTMQSAMSQIPSEPPGGSESETEDGVESDRLGGTGRIETAVEISQDAFPEGADEVFLARADQFPDALAGSSLTDRGPILLVPSCGEVPQVVLDEIERLSPNRVVALGGETAICEQVLEDAVEAAEGADGGSESPNPSESGSESEFPTESESPGVSETPTECEEIPIIQPCPTETPSGTPTNTPSATPSASPTATETPVS
jgi:hypothetical protein